MSDFQARPSSGGQYHTCVHPLMGLPQTDHSFFCMIFTPPLPPWDRFIMGYHGVHLLYIAV